MSPLPCVPARPLAWLVIVALLLAQTLGLLHGVAHGGGPVQRHLHDLGPGASHDAGLLASLFSSHEGDPDCRLFDQASHGSAAPAVAPLVFPMMLSALLVAISQGEVIARWAALFEARGPPLTR